MYRKLVTVLLATSWLCSPLQGQSIDDSQAAAIETFDKLKLKPREKPPMVTGTDSQFLILPLKQLSVRTAIAAIEKFHPDIKLIIDGDVETNQLWMRGDQQSLQQIQVFVNALEEATPAKSTELSPPSPLAILKDQEQVVDRRGSESYIPQTNTDGSVSYIPESTLAMDAITAPLKSPRSVTPAIRQQELETIELASQVKQGSNQRTELRESVAKAFRLKQDQQRDELQSLQKRVDALALQIDIREDSAERIISQRIEDLLNPELDWQTTGRNDTQQPTAQPPTTDFTKPFVGGFKVTGIDLQVAYDVVATLLAGEEGVRLSLDTNQDILVLLGTVKQHERVRRTLEMLSNVNSQADDSSTAKKSVTIRLSDDGKALQLQSSSPAELKRVEDALYKLPNAPTAKHGAVKIESIPELDLVVVRGEKAAVERALKIINKIRSEDESIQSSLGKTKHDSQRSPVVQTVIEQPSAAVTEDSAVKQ